MSDINQEKENMKFFTFEIIIEKEEGGAGYFAYSPSLPGCFSNGKTIEEAKRNIREALQQHITAMQEHSLPIPQREHIVHVEELSIGLA